MGKSIERKIEELSSTRRAAVEARATELIQDEMSLRQLRKAIGLTQVQLAATLGVGQDSISRMEARPDLLLSTLRNIVTAMGGELELVARFPGGRVVVLHTGERRDEDKAEAR